MKKNILFLTFIFLALGSMAQFPLINDAVKQEWSEVSYGVYAPPQGRVCNDIATIFYGEKIFQNGYEYISVMRNISEVQTLLGYMRQDGEKYYFNPKDNEDEFLLYDFSLEKNDIQDEIIPTDIIFKEGSLKQIQVNAYERNPQARKKCLEKHGYSCKCCGFNFEVVYGELGKNFIHVHHVTPLSQIKMTYILNPETDLIPVCANCHAMIHRKVPPYTIDEIQKLMRQKN